MHRISKYLKTIFCLFFLSLPILGKAASDDGFCPCQHAKLKPGNDLLFCWDQVARLVSELVRDGFYVMIILDFDHTLFKSLGSYGAGLYEPTQLNLPDILQLILRRLGGNNEHGQLHIITSRRPKDGKDIGPTIKDVIGIDLSPDNIHFVTDDDAEKNNVYKSPKINEILYNAHLRSIDMSKMALIFADDYHETIKDALLNAGVEELEDGMKEPFVGKKFILSYFDDKIRKKKKWAFRCRNYKQRPLSPRITLVPTN